jgi:hypothetical protein
MQEKRPLRRQPEDHHFWSLIMLAVTASAFLLVVWVATKALFFIAEVEFLLDALGEIEPGPAMRTLAVSAHREVARGVPSGVRPRRRLCDAAVDAFAARLKPELGSPLAPSRRYPPEQIAKAREAILELLPR